MGNSLDIDVTPPDLLIEGDSYLGNFLREIDRQWPQGRNPEFNGHGSRIGTVSLYFDSEDILHMHFRERGAYLQREGYLDKVPYGHLASYDINPVFNAAGTKAVEVGELLVSLPKAVDPNDARWTEIGRLLSQMHNEAR